MANAEQLSILKQGAKIWNNWRKANPRTEIDLWDANLSGVDLNDTNLAHVNLIEADLSGASLIKTRLVSADLWNVDLSGANLTGADLTVAELERAELRGANLVDSNFEKAKLGFMSFTYVDLSGAIGLDSVIHTGPSTLGTNTIVLSKGRIPEAFLRGCGMSDWEVETVKLYNPDLANEEIIKIQYKIYDLRATQSIQISPLFISYSHADSSFVDKLDNYLNKKGVRFWRDVHHATAGRLETQIDRAMRINPTVLLILSEDSLQSDWVEHEVRTARALEKEMKRDVLCPVALDDSWKKSPWSKRIMEQVMEYNILDFSSWKDDDKFGNIFNKLIDGLELFYK